MKNAVLNTLAQYKKFCDKLTLKQLKLIKALEKEIEDINSIKYENTEKEDDKFFDLKEDHDLLEYDLTQILTYKTRLSLRIQKGNKSPETDSKLIETVCIIIDTEDTIFALIREAEKAFANKYYAINSKKLEVEKAKLRGVQDD